MLYTSMIFCGAVLLAFYCSLRLFLPVFLTTLILGLTRFSWVPDDIFVVQLAKDVPAYLKHPVCPLLLGIAALAEIILQRWESTRLYLLERFDRFLKTGAVAFFLFTVLMPKDRILSGFPAGNIVTPGSGYVIPILAALTGGAAAYAFCALRRKIRNFFNPMDVDNSLRLQSLLNIGEETIVYAGVAMALLLPVGEILFIPVVCVGILLFCLCSAKQDASTETNCEYCSAKIMKTALICQECGGIHSFVNRFKLFFPDSKNTIAKPEGVAEHKILLASSKRCPHCGLRVPSVVDKKCVHCASPMLDPELAEDYFHYYDQKAILYSSLMLFVSIFPPLTFPLMLAAGLYTDFMVINPCRTHLPPFVRAVHNALALLLIPFAAIPLAGGVFTILLYRLNRNGLKKLIRSIHEK